MQRISWVLGFVLLAALGAARAQTVVPGGPPPMVCAYNATLPTLAIGATGFVQCDSNGRLLSSGGSGGGGAVYGPNAIGSAPTQPPILNGFADANGNVQKVAPSTPLPTVLPDVRSSGTLNLTSTSNVLSIPIPQGASSFAFTITGVTAGAAAVQINQSYDGTNYLATTRQTVNGGKAYGPITVDITGGQIVSVAGAQIVQFSVFTTGTGSATVNYVFSSALAQPTGSVSTAAAPGGVASLVRVPNSTVTTAPATTNATLLKSTAGRLYKLRGCNYATNDLTFHFTNSATAPTAGTTPVQDFFTAPASATAGKCNPYSFDFGDYGEYFSTGIGFWVSQNPADADTTAPAATGAYSTSIGFQ